MGRRQRAAYFRALQEQTYRRDNGAPNSQPQGPWETAGHFAARMAREKSEYEEAVAAEVARELRARGIN